MPRRSSDPYSGFRFLLQLGGVSLAGFSECSGLAMQTKVVEYKEGGNNFSTLKFPEHTSHSNVTLKRGVTGNPELLLWQFSVASGTFAVNSRQGPSDVTLVLQDEKGNFARMWLLRRVLPVQWKGPDLKAAGSEVAIESLELTHEGIVPLL